MAGGPLAERIRARVAEDVKGLGGIGLATVQVGEDPASTVYIRRKHEAAGEAVIASTDLKLPEDISQEALVAAVELLNADDEIDGILVQLPLPRHLDEAAGRAGDRPGQGRGRRAPVQRGAALPRSADARARDPARDHGAARGVPASGSTARARS